MCIYAYMWTLKGLPYHDVGASVYIPELHGALVESEVDMDPTVDDRNTALFLYPDDRNCGSIICIR